MTQWSHEDRQALLTDAAERSKRYVAGIDQRPVAPTASSLEGLDRFLEELPESPSDPAETLAMLDDLGSPATVATTGGRYFGFVIGATLPIALAASWLSAAWDQNAALPVMSPIAARLHEVANRWLVDVLNLPSGSAAAFVGGATMANATALAAARDAQLSEAGWDVQAHGLRGAPDLAVVVGEKAHSTIFKSLGLVGLGRENVHRVAADDQGRMIADRLPRNVKTPAIVCVQAGEVNTGAFDPLPEVISWARERGVWVHVDGAFGLWALADPARDHLTAGISDADSWATDGHKWLNVTYDCGIVLVRRPGDLLRSFGSSAGYLPSGDGFEAMHYSPQASQRARQVEVWAALRTLGREGVAELVNRTCGHAQAIAAGLRDSGLEVLNEVVLNQVLVRAGTDDRTMALLDSVQRDGVCWCGPTVWNGRPAMRISVSSWATSDDDVAASVNAISSAALPVVM